MYRLKPRARYAATEAARSRFVCTERASGQGFREFRRVSGSGLGFRDTAAVTELTLPETTATAAAAVPLLLLLLLSMPTLTTAIAT